MLSVGMVRRRANALRFAAAFGLLTAAHSAAGQSGVWASHGPAGGNIYCLAQDPSNAATLYAGTGQGVYKSDDGGANWRPSGTGLPAVRVQTIAIDPTATATIYAGTLTPNGVPSVGIFKSTDGGGTWTDINEGLIDPITLVSPLDVEALAIDPRHAGTIYAGTRFSEIFKSTDGGTTWQFKTLGGFNVALETSAFQFDPNVPLKIYAASTSGILLSSDGGESWSVLGNTVSIFGLVMDPASPSTLYAGNLTGYGFLKSTDGGAHFISMNSGLPSSGSNAPSVIAIALDPLHSSNIYIGTYGNGLFASTDSGSHWTRADSGIRSAYVSAFALPPGQSSRILAATLGGGSYQSADGAHTWTPSGAGLDLSLVSALVSDPAASDTLYSAAFDGVYRSTDGGNSWQASGTGLPVAPVAAMTRGAGSASTLFAGTLGGGLFKSSDGGTTWNASAQGLTDSYISSIAVDPSNSSTLYAGTAHPDTSQSERVFKSTDGGGTWTQTSLDGGSSTVDLLAVNPTQSQQILAASRNVIGYFQSVDAGKTWSTVSSATSCGGVNAFLFDPSGSPLYIAGTTGVCRSTDGGKTWVVAPVGNFSVDSLAIDPSNSSVLYAGTALDIVNNAAGIFQSTDGGQTWQALGSAFPPAPVRSLLLDSSKRLHAGTYGAGVVELVVPPERSPVLPPPSSGHHAKPLAPRS